MRLHGLVAKRWLPGTGAPEDVPADSTSAVIPSTGMGHDIASSEPKRNMARQELRNPNTEEDTPEIRGGTRQSRHRVGEPNPPETASEEGGRQAPHIPGNVETSRAKLVYVSLGVMREADIDALSRATRVPQIRLIPVLETLVDRGHVERDGLTFSLPTVR